MLVATSVVAVARSAHDNFFCLVVEHKMHLDSEEETKAVRGICVSWSNVIAN